MKPKNEWRLFLFIPGQGMASDEQVEDLVTNYMKSRTLKRLGDGHYFIELDKSLNEAFEPTGQHRNIFKWNEILYGVVLYERGLPMVEADPEIQEAAMKPSGMPDEIRKFVLGLSKE